MEYFAYGSNMDNQRMRERKINFTERFAAYLSGYSLKFNKIAESNPREGKANIVPNDECRVEGALYYMNVIDLPKLDTKEGYPGHYLKIPIKVQLKSSDQEICAITYIANPEKIKDGLKPTKKYLGHLLKGEDVLSKDYLEWLKNTKTLD